MTLQSLIRETSTVFPLPAERIAWRTLMRALCEASSLDHTIPFMPESHLRDIDAEMQSYEEDITLLQTIIQHKRALTSPFRRRHIPYEILGRIFMELRQIDPCAPATVSQVCGLWREVALRYRELWTRIELGRQEISLTRVSEWAKRAGTFPLDVVVRCSVHARRENLVPWLGERSGGIKSLTILHMDPSARNQLVPSLPPVPCMESLRIIGLEEFDLDLRSIARILSCSPSLTSLCLSGVSGLQNPESLAGVAAQLTHLSIGALSYVDCRFPLQVDAVLEIVSACKSLRTLECHSLSEEFLEPKVVSLPQLCSLSIGDGPDTCVILKYLDVPRLQTLRLVCGQILDENEELVENRDTEDRRPDYVEFLVKCIGDLHNNCSPKINTVIWERTPVHIGVLKRCTIYLQHMEQLECHGLANCIGIESLWGILSTDVAGSTCPYPQLRRIVFTNCTPGHLHIPSDSASIARSSSIFAIPPPINRSSADGGQSAIEQQPHLVLGPL